MRPLIATIIVHQPIQEQDQGDGWERGSSVFPLPVYWLDDLKKIVAVVARRRLCLVNSVRVDVIMVHSGAAQHHHASVTTKAATSWTAGVGYWILWPASFCCCTLADYCCWRRWSWRGCGWRSGRPRTTTYPSGCCSECDPWGNSRSFASLPYCLRLWSCSLTRNGSECLRLLSYSSLLSHSSATVNWVNSGGIWHVQEVDSNYWRPSVRPTIAGCLVWPYFTGSKSWRLSDFGCDPSFV